MKLSDYKFLPVSPADKDAALDKWDTVIDQLRAGDNRPAIYAHCSFCHAFPARGELGETCCTADGYRCWLRTSPTGECHPAWTPLVGQSRLGAPDLYYCIKLATRIRRRIASAPTTP